MATRNQVLCGDCDSIMANMARRGRKFDTVFMDPPDGIKLNYDVFKDRWASEEEYCHWLLMVTMRALQLAPAVWVSYNAKHDLGYKFELAAQGLTGYYNFKQFIQTFTFGQHRHSDCGNDHRPLLRITAKDAKLYPDAIRVQSWRQEHGDKRADPRGRVPGDVWDFPRVTGNSRQRRNYHPTQLHEGLVERALRLTTPEGGSVLDPFGGTGTTLRAAKNCGFSCTLVELSPFYCKKIAEEHRLKVRKHVQPV